MERRLDEKQVIAVPEVPFTKSWHPWHHKDVIMMAEKAVKEEGLDIIDRDYSMSANGMDCFAVWKLSEEKNGSHWSLGWRNSMQKMFGLGFAAGKNVTVCSNMCFSGETVEIRKHTNGLTEESLLALCKKAMSKVVKRLKKFDRWFDNLALYPLEIGKFKEMVFEAMLADAFAPSQFHAFLEAHNEEVKIYKPNMEKGMHGTIHEFHGACTRLMRTGTLFTVQERNANLVKLVDYFRKDIEPSAEIIEYADDEEKAA